MTTKTIHRVAKNTGILYLRMAITVFISLYATRLTLTALGVEDFGLYNLVGGVIAMLGFLNASMASATQRFMSFAQGEGDLEKIKRIFNMSTLLHFGIAIAVVIILEIAGYIFFNGFLNIEPDRLPVAKLVYQFMVASTLFTIISVPYEAVITSHENMLFYAILGIIESVLKLFIALYVAYGSMSLPSGIFYLTGQIQIIYNLFDNLVIYSFLMACLTILMLITKRIYCHKTYPECEINFKKHYNPILFKEITHFASWSFLGSATSMISHYGQSIVVNFFFGTKVNAAQGINDQVTGQLASFSNVMLKALNPMIVKSEGAGNRELVLKTTMLGSKIAFFLLMLFYLPAFIEMPYIFNLWLKNVPDYAIIFCRLFFIRSLIDQLFTNLSVTISAIGKIAKFQLITSLLQCLPLVFTFILFKYGYPPYTIYIVFIIYSIMNSAIILLFSKKLYNLSINIFLKDVFMRCFLSSVIIYLITSIPLLLMNEGMERLITVLFLDGITFLIVVGFIGFTKNERLNFIKITKEIYFQKV